MGFLPHPTAHPHVCCVSSTDPVAMFEAVLPSLQKRMMDGLADTGFWYPILIDFIKDHILSVPFIQEALGGLKIGVPAGPLMIPGNETLRETAQDIVEADYADFCTDAGEAVDKADEVIAKTKTISYLGNTARAHIRVPTCPHCMPPTPHARTHARIHTQNFKRTK